LTPSSKLAPGSLIADTLALDASMFEVMLA
jgi:hypothetical protein